MDNNLNALWILQIICATILVLLLLYIFIVATPLERECKSWCNSHTPNKENYIDSGVQAFTNLCQCYYSNSIKNRRMI